MSLAWDLEPEELAIVKELEKKYAVYLTEIERDPLGREWRFRITLSFPGPKWIEPCLNPPPEFLVKNLSRYKSFTGFSLEGALRQALLFAEENKLWMEQLEKKLEVKE
jgi:hypothetical protein